MNRIRNKIKLVIIIIIPLLLNFLVLEQIFSNIQNTGSIQNIRWLIKSEVIIINYDLIGSENDKFDVKVVMKKENDPTIEIVPITVEGDIGIGNFAGINREIIWYYRRDIPQGISSEDKYYFEINVKEITSSKTWIYYTVGAILVASGIVLFITNKSKDKGEQELPLPPGRP